MKTKDEIIEYILEMIPGSFEGAKKGEIRFPIDGGKEAKLTVTIAKDTMGAPLVFSDQPSQNEIDELGSLISALGV